MTARWFRGGLVFKAHRLVHLSVLGSRVIKKKKDGRNLAMRLRRDARVNAGECPTGGRVPTGGNP